MVSTYGRCNNCATIKWDSPAALREFGYGCRKCGSNETTYQGPLSIFERIYLLRWYWWEMNRLNRSLCDGEPEPYWYLKLSNVRAFLKEFWRGTTQESC